MVREKGLPFFPEGEFVGEDFIENDGLTLDEPVKMKITLRKYPEKMILDFDGTAGQAKGPINWPLDGRHYSKWLGAFFKAQIPGIAEGEVLFPAPRGIGVGIPLAAAREELPGERQIGIVEVARHAIAQEEVVPSIAVEVGKFHRPGPVGIG